MEDSELQATFREIEQQLTGSKFKTIHSQYSPELYGNYYIDISNGNLSYRLIKDRGQYFLEGKSEDSDNWNDINQFIEANFAGSTLVFDMKLHKVGKGDFTFETILKLLPKLLLISQTV